MNWAAISFDWNQVRAFLAAAEEGSLSGAARVLKSTQPTIGRQLAALEQALGLALVERSVRGLHLTEAGQEFREHALSMAEAAARMSIAAEGRSQQIAGDVTLTATDLMASGILPGLLAPLRDIAPGIRLRLSASNDLQNLMQREADIAIRHVRPDQPELIARHIGNMRASLYAATSYLDRIGRPASPRAISALSFVGFPDPERLIAPLHDLGVPVRPEQFTMSSENNVVIWELTRAGFGVSLQPELLAEAEDGLERVWPDLPALEFPVWLVTHRDLQTSRRIRVVFDLLVRGLSGAARTG